MILVFDSTYTFISFESLLITKFQSVNTNWSHFKMFLYVDTRIRGGQFKCMFLISNSNYVLTLEVHVSKRIF